ncbi:MAG: hypothetical protein HYY16_13820 [Planctomycetes bacterium]|nr:hypothetical protein [Planctomycetota bacterium]
MKASTKARTRIGAEAGFAWRRRVYLAQDALEIDEIGPAVIERRRVYFDDVLAMTYHRRISVAALILFALCAVLCVFIAILTFGGDAAVVGAVCLVIAAFFATGFVVHLLLRTDVITIYGRRTMARLTFTVRKARARRIFQDLVARIRARQAQMAASAPPVLPNPSPPADA